MRVGSRPSGLLLYRADGVRYDAPPVATFIDAHSDPPDGRTAYAAGVSLWYVLLIPAGWTAFALWSLRRERLRPQPPR